MATLRLVPVSGPAIDVVKDQSMVGRDPSCEIVVTDGSVSRRHARLEKRGSAWWVVDQGSANGTYVNSLKVAEQALKNNQELRFGALAFRVDLHEDPEATVATPFLADDSATVMAPSTPPPCPPRRLPRSRRRPRGPPPRRPCPTPPSAPPPAAAERRRGEGALPAGGPGRAGAADARRARRRRRRARARSSGSPSAAAAACCSSALLAGVIGGGVFMATKGAADAAHAWLGQVRQGQSAEVAAGMTEAYRSRPTAEEVAGDHHRDRAVEGRDLPEPLRGQRPRDADRRPDRRRRRRSRS